MKASRFFLGVCAVLALTGKVAFAHQQAAGQSYVSSDALYARQAGQVFKTASTLQLKIGFLEGGDDEPYLTWDGRVSGKPVYLEIHGDSLRVKAGRVWHSLKLSEAYRLKSDVTIELDARKGSDLFVHSPKKAQDSLMCVESLPADSGQVSPMRAVFVVTHALTHPVLYQLPATYGSCRGLTFESGQGIKAPSWIEDPSDPLRYTIQYVPLSDNGFGAPSGVMTRVRSPGHVVDTFEVETP